MSEWESVCNFIYSTNWSSEEVEIEIKAAALDWKDTLKDNSSEDNSSE